MGLWIVDSNPVSDKPDMIVAFFLVIVEVNQEPDLIACRRTDNLTVERF